MCLIDGTCESGHSPAGSLSTCACISGILSVGVDLERGSETGACLREPYFFERTWYYALISAPIWFGTFTSDKNDPIIGPIFKSSPSEMLHDTWYFSFHTVRP